MEADIAGISATTSKVLKTKGLHLDDSRNLSLTA